MKLRNPHNSTRDRCEALTNDGQQCGNDASAWILVRGRIAAHVCHVHEDRRHDIRFIFDEPDE